MINGQILKKWRKEMGMELSDLAKLTRLPVTYLIEIEEGVRDVTPGAFGKIIEHIDVPSEDMDFLTNEYVGGLGIKIRALRDKQNYTLEELSKLTDLSITYLSEIERGERIPPFATLRKIAKVLCVPVSIFIGSDRKNSYIGEKLKNIRAAKNLTQEQLGKLAGVSAGMIAQMESGKVQPSIKTLEKLCRILNVSLCYLALEREDIDEIVVAIPEDLREILYHPKVQMLLGSLCFLTDEQFSMIINFIDMIRQNSNFRECFTKNNDIFKK